MVGILIPIINNKNIILLCVGTYILFHDILIYHLCIRLIN